MIDFKTFKKVSDDGKVATMEHEQGHKVQIVKSALTKKLQDQLDKLPLHQSEGSDEPINSTGGKAMSRTKELLREESPQTTYSPEDPIPFTQDSPPGMQNQINAGSPIGSGGGIMPSVLGGTPLSPMATSVLSTPANAQGGTSDVPTPDAVPEDPLAAYKQVPGVPNELAGIQGTSSTLDKQGQAIARAEHANQVQEYASQQQLNRDLLAKQAEMDAVVKDIREGHIDPNHYLSSGGAPRRIATAIGLILGGISSGQTGQPNPALTYLNKQIENDLDSQKADMANKHNLFSALSHQYGDRLTAENMYKAIRSRQLASQIAEAAGTAQSGLAKAQAQSATGAVLQQAGTYLRQATLAGMQAGVQHQAGTSGDMDSRAQQYLQAEKAYGDPKKAEEFEKRYIPGVGVAQVPLESKDRELLQKKTELKGLLDRAGNYLGDHKGYGALPFTADKAEGTSLQNQIQLKMGELADLTRFTPEENKIYKQSTPDLTGTHFTEKDHALLQGLRDSNDTSLNTFYQQKGIPRQSGDTDAVRVLHPDGKSGLIPRSYLKQALQSGYKEVR